MLPSSFIYAYLCSISSRSLTQPHFHRHRFGSAASAVENLEWPLHTDALMAAGHEFLDGPWVVMAVGCSKVGFLIKILLYHKDP